MKDVLIVKFSDPGTPEEIAPMVKYIGSRLDEGEESGVLGDGTEWALMEDS